MTTLEAFLMGIMVAYTPSVLCLAWLLRSKSRFETATFG
jgi:hypothetical protein